MNVIRDDWSGLFNELLQKISAEGRRELMFQVINDIDFVTRSNFGEEGLARPSEWASLNRDYAKEYHDGDTTPTLILSPSEHLRVNPDSPLRMIESFSKSFSPNNATLKNSAEYFTEHQFGKGNMYRPTMPITEDGSDLTAFQWERIRGILDAHFEH